MSLLAPSFILAIVTPTSTPLIAYSQGTVLPTVGSMEMEALEAPGKASQWIYTLSDPSSYGRQIFSGETKGLQHCFATR